MQRRFISLLCICAILLAAPARAQKQGQAFTDSLLKELPKAKTDTGRARILYILAGKYALFNTDSGLIFAKRSLELAMVADWKDGMAWANRNIGLNYDYKTDLTEAMKYYRIAETLFREAGDNRGLASVASNIGSIYHTQSDYTHALEYFNTALSISEKIHDREVESIVSGNMGLMYSEQSNFVKALEYDFRALKINEEMNDRQGIASVTGNIGIVYYNRKEYDKALEYYFKAVKLDEELGNKLSTEIFTGNIGNVYSDINNFPKALEYDNKALEVAKQIGDKVGVSVNTINIGEIYIKEKKYLLGIAWCQDALKLSNEIGDRRTVAAELNDIGTAYLSLVTDTSAAGRSTDAQADDSILLHKAIPGGKAARLQQAIAYFERGLDTAIKINTPDIILTCYTGLAEASELSGNCSREVACYKNILAIKDSIFSKENSVKIARLELNKKMETDSLRSATARKETELKYRQQRVYTYIGIAGVVALMFFSFFIIRERRKSDHLLLNILPSEVAAELKNKGSSDAKHFDNVTVLFTDFVNFTEAGERMSPQALIDELHACFKAFDEIVTRYGIEKIKTIGDAYLAVAGLPVADANHAEHAVKAAIDINRFMEARMRSHGDQTFRVRIGINSGSVVAGIVGVKKFSYDVWGDTVNTAARMEQNSEPGRINISESTYQLVKDKVSCTYRGEIDAKNKGMLRMYFVS